MALAAADLHTIIILWVLAWASMALMAFRLFMRKIRGQRFDVSDYITMACMGCLMARLSMVTVVLLWGSNNLTDQQRATLVFTDREVYQRIIGGKLTVINRTFYNTYVWLQKCVVMILYKRILNGLGWTPIVMNIYWAILGVTYIVIQISTFTDCRPFYLYWQMYPDPGHCSEALNQLIILGALNIFTDLMLIALPMPVFFTIRRTFMAKVQLVGLFSIGFFLVATTVIRLPLNFSAGTQQVSRTTWASVEAFMAAFVANVPTLYTLRRQGPIDDSSIPYNERPTYGSSKSGFKEVNGSGDHAITVTKSIEMHDNMSTKNDDEVDVDGSWDKRARLARNESETPSVWVKDSSEDLVPSKARGRD